MNKTTYKNNKSGYKGVYKRKDRNKWCAEIKINRNRVIIGYYDNKEDAAKAYNDAAIKFHKEFARLNSI